MVGLFSITLMTFWMSMGVKKPYNMNLDVINEFCTCSRKPNGEFNVLPAKDEHGVSIVSYDFSSDCILHGENVEESPF